MTTDPKEPKMATTKQEQKQEWFPHPDYGSGAPGDERGDRCECGGIRHWHATVEGGGCEDCPCPEFQFDGPR